MTPEERRAYTAGFDAYGYGVPLDACPYPSWGRFGQFNRFRYLWMIGWFEAKEDLEAREEQPLPHEPPLVKTELTLSVQLSATTIVIPQ